MIANQQGREFFIESLWAYDTSRSFVVMGMEEMEAILGLTDPEHVQLEAEYGRIVANTRQEAIELLIRGMEKGIYPTTSQLVEEFTPEVNVEDIETIREEQNYECS